MLSTLAVVAVVGSLASQQPETGVSAEAAAWVKAHAVPLKTCEAGNGFEDLAGLKDVVGKARIVSLGEPTHGTREAFQLKHRLLEYLATEMGFRVFSIEANMPESYNLNEYVLEGKGDPRKLIGGMYFWTWNTEEVLAMVEWMKTFNEAGRAREGASFVPLRFTGFDMQTPDVAATVAIDGVRAIDPALADEMVALYGKLPEIQRQAAGQGNGDGTGIMVGSFPPDAAKGKKVRVSAWIKTKDVGTFAGWWFRCDKPDQSVGAFNNMADFGPKGTTDWKRYEFTLDVPADTVNINFGPLIVGSGEAWFDDIEIELDGVVYSDPAKFSFDFENPAVLYLTATTPGTKASRVKEGVHGGTTCLYVGALIGKEPENKVDPAEVEAKTDELLTRLKGMRGALAAKHGETQAEWIIQNARVVSQCASMLAAGNMMGGAVRDESMATNVKWILDQDPAAKIVLWAHNGHVSRAEAYGQEWMGAHLTTMFPGQSVVFGFATGSGRYTAMAPGEGLKSDNQLLEPPAGSVEAHMASVGAPVLMLDLRGAAAAGSAAAWIASPTQMRSIGALATPQQFYPQNLAESYDVLLYIAESTASRTLR
ncbi:MAG: erythromycin esterase family protein [Phycisphaerales bacterium]